MALPTTVIPKKRAYPASRKPRELKVRQAYPASEYPGALWLPLTKGKRALIDEADWEIVKYWNWSYRPSVYHDRWREQYGYAVRGVSDANGKYQSVYLHRFLMQTPPDLVVDHINFSTLDCRRSNMRNASRTLNSHNRRSFQGSSCEFKGVSKVNNRWHAEIWQGSIRYPLGSFETPEKAARAYDAKARELYGSDAYTNFSYLQN